MVGSRPSPTPRATVVRTSAPATAGPGLAPHLVIFDRRGFSTCDDTGSASIPAGDNVWWAAQLAEPRPATEDVVWVLYVNGDDFISGRRPGPDGVGTYDCVRGGPIRNVGPGTYRLVIWDGAVQNMLAGGEVEVLG